MSKSIYVILPVADLTASTRFYEQLGCARNAQFSDANAVSMVWSDAITFQLMTRAYFANCVPRPIADARQTCEVLVVLTQESRAAVDAMVKAVASAGGKADIRAVMDSGWLYNRAFTDPDGHVFESVWMDTQAIPSKM